MSASRASVSGEAAGWNGGSGSLLVVGVNWLGDSVMSLPALRALHRARPDLRRAMLVKSPLVPFWRLAAGLAGEIMLLEEGIGGTWRTAQRVRRAGFAAAVILPQSFRSALVPWLARVPERRGLPGRGRDLMLTDPVRPVEAAGRVHQAYRYYDLLGLAPNDDDFEGPLLQVDVPAQGRILEEFGRHLPLRPGRFAALLPGAARGPSKRWPADRFIAAGRSIAAHTGWPVCVLGGAGEAADCAAVAAGIGTSAANFAGRTSLPMLAALLAQCGVVVANDSGGMHMAAAVGAPVVGIFGLTDPAQTGPLGKFCRVVRPAGVTGASAIPRRSEEARAALETIAPDDIVRAAMDLIGAGAARGGSPARS